ncbi:hypothetical protein C8J57DRAFT_234051 [Mycena rebaudengoi]|nr:hypothetical protein C8J57DRAFT_234051 [Mycena rebaudengoi]
MMGPVLPYYFPHSTPSRAHRHITLVFKASPLPSLVPAPFFYARTSHPQVSAACCVWSRNVGLCGTAVISLLPHTSVWPWPHWRISFLSLFCRDFFRSSRTRTAIYLSIYPCPYLLLTVLALVTLASRRPESRIVLVRPEPCIHLLHTLLLLPLIHTLFLPSTYCICPCVRSLSPRLCSVPSSCPVHHSLTRLRPRTYTPISISMFDTRHAPYLFALIDK